MAITEIHRALRTFISERQLERPLARGDAHDVRSVERDMLARLAHAPPPAVMTAVAEEVARLQEARRQAWLRAEQARARTVRAHVERAGADVADKAIGDPHERVEREAAERHTRRVLVAVDGSEASTRALDFAVALAAQRGADLELVAAVEGAPGSVTEEIRGEALHRAAARVPRPGPRVHERILLGPASTVLLHEAQQPGVELIVMGRRGERDDGRPQPGSCSQAVVAHALVPVVVVP